MPNSLLDPKQELFLSVYTNPKSPTFGNALQSGLKAGYSQEYSESITHQMPDWLSDNLGKLKRLQKALKVLDETLEMEYKDEDTGKIDSQIAKLRADVAKFIAKSSPDFSDKLDITSGGEPLQIASELTGRINETTPSTEQSS